MINSIQTREDLNQANGIDALKEEAITDTNNTIKIVEDLKKTEDTIDDLQNSQRENKSTISNEELNIGLSSIEKLIQSNNIKQLKQPLLLLLSKKYEDKNIKNYIAILKNMGNDNDTIQKEKMITIIKAVKDLFPIKIDNNLLLETEKDFIKIYNEILNNKNTQEKEKLKDLWKQYFDLAQKLGQKKMENIGETFTIPKIRMKEGKIAGYNEDALYLDKDIAIISDGVSDSTFSYKTHELVKYLAENKGIIRTKEDIQNIILNFMKKQDNIGEGGSIGSLCIVINNKDGSKTGFVLGDSSIFVDKIEYKNTQANIGIYKNTPETKIPRGFSKNNSGNLIFRDNKITVSIPTMTTIAIPNNSKVILSTDAVADYIRNSNFLQSTGSIPALLKSKSIIDGPEDDLSYIIIK